MPRLPDKTALGGLPNLNANEGVVTGSQYGATAVAGSLEKLGDAEMKAVDEQIQKRDALDAAKWEAARRPQYESLVDEFHKDPDYKTFEPRFKEAVSKIDQDAEGLVTNPQLRERLRYKAAVEADGALRRVLTHGNQLRRQDEFAQADDAIGQMVSPTINPDTTPESAAETLRQAQAHIENLKNTGALDPAQAHHLQDRHITGLNGVLPRIAANRLWSDPYGTLTDLGVANQTNATPERRSDGMAVIRSGSGAPLTVSADHADRFKGLIDDLEAAGVNIKPEQSGGYNPRNIRGTNTPSQHASGRAIDINWDENAQGTQGKIDPDLARSLASKWGLKWGGDFSKPDPMHFEVAKDAKPLPKSEAAPDDATPPEDRAPAMPDKGSAWADLYSRMSPQARAHLITNARTALSDTTQRDLKDAAAEVTRTGQIPTDESGKTALDRAARILSPNQLSKARRGIDDALMGFKATAPLADMTEDDAAAHLDKFVPELGTQGYATAAKVKERADKDWQRIKDLRTTDFVKAISGGTIKGAGAPTLGVGENGDVTVRQDESDVRLRPAREIQSALSTIKTALESDRVPAGANGKLFTTLRTDPIAAREMLLDARMAAQQRLAPDRPDTWHLISREEGDALLRMPKTAYKDLDSKTYRDGVKAAADRFYQFYGPKYGRKAFEDAIGFHLSKEDDLKAADKVMSKVVSAYAFDGTLDRTGLDRVKNLQELDRVGRLFEGQGQFDAGNFAGAGQRRGAEFMPPARDTMTGVTDYASRQAQATARTPSPDDIAWATAKPSRQADFDKRFGAGAYARALSERQK